MTLQHKINWLNRYLKSPGVTQADAEDALAALGTPPRLPSSRAVTDSKRARLLRVMDELANPAPQTRVATARPAASKHTPAPASTARRPAARTLVAKPRQLSAQDAAPIPLPGATISLIPTEQELQTLAADFQKVRSGFAPTPKAVTLAPRAMADAGLNLDGYALARVRMQGAR